MKTRQGNARRRIINCRGIALLLGFAASACLGYGGFGMTASFADLGPLNQRLTELNTGEPPNGWNGKDTFRLNSPLWWLGGHGAARVGDVTIGGGGAATIYNISADSVDASIYSLIPAFQVGYIYEPIEYLWIRPCLDIGGGAWVNFVHSKESTTQPNFSQWFYAWTIGATPGLELMGRMPYGGNKVIGLYVKAGYFLPVYGPNWAGDDDPPPFDFKGIMLEAGIRFDRKPLGALRI